MDCVFFMGDNEDMENEMNAVLLLDEEFAPVLNKYECTELQLLIKRFIEYYKENADKPVEEWLGKNAEQLPDKKPEEIWDTVRKIITAIKANGEKSIIGKSGY